VWSPCWFHEPHLGECAEARIMALVDVSEFSCAICLETLHKPAVNHCGHAFCFWCFHHAMSGLGTSRCSLCRADVRHFAATCKPLHWYLQLRFAADAAEREEQTKSRELSEWNAESPALAPAPESWEELSTRFHCAGCGKMAAPPAVLACGHVVCARPGGWPNGCPVAGCTGSMSRSGNADLAVCGVIDALLRAEDAAEYANALAAGCTAQGSDSARPQTSACTCSEPAQGGPLHVEQSQGGHGGPLALIGKRVELHSLSSSGAHELNGSRGTVMGFDAASQRLVVAVVAASGGVRHVRARAANVRVIDVAYVHFGRGCDGCGVYPIEGTCYKCADCSEQIGYDVCGECHANGVHQRPDSGRFNQAHRPDHRMEEVPQLDTPLHQLQRAHPEMSIDQIMALIQAHGGGG
jgi:hypothetical protein